MDVSTLNFKISATNQPLHIEAKFDGKTIWQDQIKDSSTVSHEFFEDNRQHTLSIIMSGKTHEHTKLNPTNEIIQDSCVKISEFKLNDIELDYAFYENCVYTHDLNGTGSIMQEKFFGTLGCNGTVTFSFSSPVYLWLLENT